MQTIVSTSKKILIIVVKKAMSYSFEKCANKIFKGRKLTTYQLYATIEKEAIIVPSLIEDIKITKAQNPNFPLNPLIYQVSLQNLHTIAWTSKVKTLSK